MSCPKSSQLFDTYPHYGPGNVVIDNCTRGDLIWLDFGEMRQIVDAPGRDRGGRHMPRICDEYIRTGRSQSDYPGPDTSRCTHSSRAMSL